MIPRLATERLVLDAFTLADVPALVELAGHPEIYATTLNIPHPYTAEDAQRYIAGHMPGFLNSEGATFAVRRHGRLIGDVGLYLARRQNYRAEIGYWIGRPFWNYGYATEAVRAVVQFGFQHFRLEKIVANHFAGNTTSARVLEKAGLRREGLHPDHVKKENTYIDIVSYGITRAAAAQAGLVVESTDSNSIENNFPVQKPRGLAAGHPPVAEELLKSGTGAMERALVERHFLGKTTDGFEHELRVYGKSLAPDFAHLAPDALSYYLPAAKAYLESEFAEGDCDFVLGLISSLVSQLRGGDLSPETAQRVRALVRQLRDQAPRYFIEVDKPPFASWVVEALTE